MALLKVKHFLQDVLVGLVPLLCSNLDRYLNKDGLTSTERNGTSIEIASTPGQAKGHQQAIWVVEIKENYPSQLVRNNTETQGAWFGLAFRDKVSLAPAGLKLPLQAKMNLNYYWSFCLHIYALGL